MNIRKKIKRTFIKQMKLFTPLSTEVITMIQRSLKLVTNENLRPSGGFQWTIEHEGRRSVIQLYCDGMVLVYLQERDMTYEKHLHGDGVSERYADIEDASPGIYHLTNESHLDLIVKKLKEYLIERSMENAWRPGQPVDNFALEPDLKL